MYSVKQMRAINDALVEEFRANDGVVTGPTGNSQVVVLTTTGSKTGRPHVTPLAYSLDGDRVVLIASKGGGPTNPSWYYNLLADPLVTVELPGGAHLAMARAAEGDERDRLYAAMAAQIPTFAEYEKIAPRRIPVVVLERATATDMPGEGTIRPAVAAAHERLASVVATLTDDDVRAPSRLPGWSRGHVLTHIARNADGIRRMVEGVLAGHVAAMYPGGLDERTRDIEDGAGRSATVLADDAVTSAARLVEAWDRLDEDQWRNGTGLHPLGEVAVATAPFRRLREVEVHLADLGLDGCGVDEWTDAYARGELPLAVAGLDRRLPPGVRARLHATDTGHRADAGDPAGDVVPVELEVRPLVGWLLGRWDAPAELGLPTLRPW